MSEQDKKDITSSLTTETKQDNNGNKDSWIKKLCSQTITKIVGIVVPSIVAAFNIELIIEFFKSYTAFFTILIVVIPICISIWKHYERDIEIIKEKSKENRCRELEKEVEDLKKEKQNDKDIELELHKTEYELEQAKICIKNQEKNEKTIETQKETIHCLNTENEILKTKLEMLGYSEKNEIVNKGFKTTNKVDKIDETDVVRKMIGVS